MFKKAENVIIIRLFNLSGEEFFFSFFVVYSAHCIEIIKKEAYNAYAVGEIKKGGEGVRYA